MADAMLRKDAENLARLEKLRPRFERHKADKIRTESDGARHRQDLEKFNREAEQEIGTSDLDDIRGMAHANMVENTAAVDRFEQILDDIDERLAALSMG